MSATPMTFEAVDAILSKLGEPLNPNQRRALIKEGGRQMKDLRAEMREAVNAAFKVDNAAVMRAIKEVAERMVTQHMGSAHATIEAAVRGEISKQLGTGQSDNIATIVRGAVQKEASNQAAEAVKKALHISFNETANYEQGGQF